MDGVERERILSFKIDATTTVRDAGGMQFRTWCLNKINNQQTFNPDVQKIAALARGMPMAQVDEDSKIDYVKTLVGLGVVSLD